MLQLRFAPLTLTILLLASNAYAAELMDLVKRWDGGKQARAACIQKVWAKALKNKDGPRNYKILRDKLKKLGFSVNLMKGQTFYTKEYGAGSLWIKFDFVCHSSPEELEETNSHCDCTIGRTILKVIVRDKKSGADRNMTWLDIFRVVLPLKDFRKLTNNFEDIDGLTAFMEEKYPESTQPD